ncbi:hypothetical protein KNV35_gp90 [uncultured phage cr8_1]|uniref:Uncharacterized protein n=1 Tax=uncultured phage cr8_1 TaxID=2772068 RepID=A0A7M1RWN5_9CAUD|nr:hypothetical protein KNV35_gp90 [uncultured phage cr8_1]QOR58845.1 hypothetical protein [uncultured phage cr8_1]
MTKKCNRLRGERPKAFWGALVGGAMNLIGSAISSKSQARAIRRQIEAQKEAARTQLELANNSNLASTLNSYVTATRSYNDEDDYNLKYRLGGNKRLGSNRIYITDGGNATKIGNDTYLLRGGSHEQTNETGQTGIGINVGGNEIEAEGGEVAQKKNGALRIFSAQPILGNGMSPAQAILRGYNKDKIFNAQQAFKRRNGLKDDGGKAKWGIGWLDSLFGNDNPKKKTVHFYKSQATGKVFKTRQESIAENNKYKTNLGYRRTINREREFEAAKNKSGNERIPYIKEKEIKLSKAGKLTGIKLTTNQLDSIAKYANKVGLPIKTALGLVGQESAFGNYFGYANNAKSLNEYHKQGEMNRDIFGIPTYNIVNYERLLPNKIPTLVDDNAINDKYAKRGINKFGYSAVINGDELDKLKVQHEAYPGLAKKRAKFWKDIKVPTLELAFKAYKDHPNLYNAGNPNQQNLVNNKANDVWGSPEIQKWYRTSPYVKHCLGGRCKLRNGGLTSKDRGSSKRPYPSVSSKDFAGGGRSYPIPTKADAIDALRLAGLHGRSDVKTKVYSKYPSLRPKARIGGSWKAPVYNTNKYRVSNRMRRQIATWEGSDFAGQNRRFKGDAIGAKERELRRIMGRTYNYLNDNQRDSLNSIYYNSRVDTFKNAFGKWFRNLNSAVDRGDERAFNNSLAGIRQSITIGANRQGMSGLAKRRAWERNWFGNPIPMDSNETKAILKQQAEAKMVQPIDNTRVFIQPEYIEVPAPVGHGVVPVDNPDPNLLQGNIKDNLINMGNKFRLGQRCGGSTRMCKALGGESRPVKGMRRKLAWGDVTYPYRRNNNFDYWDIIDQEQKANDKGGISPWITSNKYDVKVPYAITKSTPTIPYTSQVSTPTSGVSENKTIPTYIGNKSGMIIRDADWYGLGADLVSSIGGSILGLGAYKNLDFDYNLPNFVEESPVALNTTYHNEAQKSNVERNRLNSRNSILRNTMSGSTAVGRMQGVDTNALYQLNQLADEKTNKETELMNQNLLNEQQVRARNAAARNQYYNTVASIKNAAIQAKNEAELAKGQILSGSLQGIGNSFQNFISQGRQNYDDTQAMLMGVAASDYATPSRLLELGVDVGDDAALAGIYRSAMNIPNPGARPKREDYSDNTEYSYALTRWENQNKAYQRRNSYADLIKGRMSKKNLIKYGII